MAFTDSALDTFGYMELGFDEDHPSEDTAAVDAFLTEVSGTSPSGSSGSGSEDILGPAMSALDYVALQEQNAALQVKVAELEKALAGAQSEVHYYEGLCEHHEIDSTSYLTTMLYPASEP